MGLCAGAWERRLPPLRCCCSAAQGRSGVRMRLLAITMRIAPRRSMQRRNATSRRATCGASTSPPAVRAACRCSRRGSQRQNVPRQRMHRRHADLWARRAAPPPPPRRLAPASSISTTLRAAAAPLLAQGIGVIVEGRRRRCCTASTRALSPHRRRGALAANTLAPTRPRTLLGPSLGSAAERPRHPPSAVPPHLLARAPLRRFSASSSASAALPTPR